MMASCSAWNWYRQEGLLPRVEVVPMGWPPAPPRGGTGGMPPAPCRGGTGGMASARVVYCPWGDRENHMPAGQLEMRYVRPSEASIRAAA
jgi:hypothetical protein